MQPSPVPADLLASHVAGSLFALLTWWLSHDLALVLEEMGKVVLSGDS
jgi:hypothetical protein